MSLHERLLGHPWVYDRLRPLVVGGIDMTPAYRNLGAAADDVVVDVGCGTGDALRYLDACVAYHGFDTDPRAIAHARKRAAERRDVHYHGRAPSPADFGQIRPTRIMLSGLLHHLPDSEALELLALCAHTPSLRRVATSDVVYLPARPVNNLLAWLDRGRHVRHVEGYRALARTAGLRIVREEIVSCHPTRGRAMYFLMALEPGPS